MIRFDIELNGEPWCRAGIDGHGVISVMLHWIDMDGGAVVDDPEHPRSALSFGVSGHRLERAYTDAEAQAGEGPPPVTPIHWRDVKHGLRTGDELRIRIVEADEADEATETPRLPPVG